MRELRSASDDEMYNQFLKSELSYFSVSDQTQLQPILSARDFGNAFHNFQRRTALFARRWRLLCQLPSCVEWHFGLLDEHDFRTLHTPKNCGWDEFCPGNLLRNVRYPDACSDETRQKIAQLLSVVGAQEFDKTLILIGEGLDGPFTILDGNHRATALFLGNRERKLSVQEIPAYIGVSNRMRQCHWYADC